MNVESVTLRRIRMPLKKPFVTHAGSVKERELIIIETADCEGTTGYGEVTAFSTPFYTAETITTAWHMLTDIFLPAVHWADISHPKELPDRLSGFQGNQMAKAGLEASLWDLYAKQKNVSLSKLIGGTREAVETGVVISLTDDLEDVLEGYLQEGYQRFKVKVNKYDEKKMLLKIQELSQGIPLMIDGNGVYQQEDLSHLKALDELHLQMIEQPFRPGDFYLHQTLQKEMDTPVCLDESISSYDDAFQALSMDSCRIINIKASRVGGLSEAIAIHDLCVESNVPVWCGGMVESGISRAHNIALASLPGFSIPGDISSSSRFWERDLIQPEVFVEKGSIAVPEKPGIGFNIDYEYLDYITTESFTFHK
ncbi:o-succinylbenzoate synthase [Thalassobacillus hwangdonensis]|uniref:o-succinylbenzoate synthase n=1 Tax=Thalassobacillus hwangdonensis TaxID=546108 RepID=A0ABW3L388_9BACI